MCFIFPLFFLLIWLCLSVLSLCGYNLHHFTTLLFDLVYIVHNEKRKCVFVDVHVPLNEQRRSWASLVSMVSYMCKDAHCKYVCIDKKNGQMQPEHHMFICTATV